MSCMVIEFLHIEFLRIEFLHIEFLHIDKIQSYNKTIVILKAEIIVVRWYIA